MMQSDMATTDFEALYERTLDEVYRYASRLTGGDRVRTDELVQETYLGVLRGHHAVAPTTSYLITACRNRFLDQLRSERRRRTREERVAIPGETPPVDPAEVGTGRAVAALAALSDEHRAALVLRYVDDLTVADVADELGRSVRATESLLVRARNALRAAYREGDRP
jgi:RNA polymerase sigma-70 factor, ECF subfamily